MTRVGVLDDYLNRAGGLAQWETLGPDVDIVFFHEPMREDDLVDALAGCEVVVVMRERTPLARSVLERLPRLELVVTTGMENASVDVEFLRERGVPFCGTAAHPSSAAGVSSTVEVAWGAILAAVKRVVVEDRAMRAGQWQDGFPSNLRGSTLGLVGLGRLGNEMVGPARAFGMEVLAWSQNLSQERAAQVGVTRASKEDLLRQSDVISIHLRLSDRTRSLIGAPDLALMKKSAVLVNTSRGPIVDERALLDALGSKQIAAAGLDVYDQEPLPSDHPLLSVGNTVLTPHLGYVSESGFREMYTQVVEDIDRFLRGTPIRLIG